MAVRASEPCAVSPVLLEADVLAPASGGRGRYSWRVDGRDVYGGVVAFEGGGPQTVAFALEPKKPLHRVALEVRVGRFRAEKEVQLALAVCPSAVEVEDFALSRAGLELVVGNRGPYPSGPGVVHWKVNGRRLGLTRLGSIAPGGRARVTLPAGASPLLKRVLARPQGEGSPRHGLPVRVSARLELASAGLAGSEGFELVVGYVERDPYPTWDRDWWLDLDRRPVQRFPEYPPHVHLPPPNR